jgi:mRNA interferase MazF
MMSSPNREEIWLVDLDYTATVRPCLLVSIPALIQGRALTNWVLA